jgi:uncharacterized protein YebE (UPF0316 family)
MSMFVGYLAIFFTRIADVTMATIRTLMVVQGRKVQAAIIGFFEIILYVLALGKVVSGLDDPGNLLAYALGFACGNYVGIYIENKIALGNLTAQVILKDSGNERLLECLRDNGFGVTVMKGIGKEGERDIFNITFNRKDLNKLKEILSEYDKNVFVTTSSTEPIMGGYFAPTKRK